MGTFAGRLGGTLAFAIGAGLLTAASGVAWASPPDSEVSSAETDGGSVQSLPGPGSTQSRNTGPRAGGERSPGRRLAPTPRTAGSTRGAPSAISVEEIPGATIPRKATGTSNAGTSDTVTSNAPAEPSARPAPVSPDVAIRSLQRIFADDVSVPALVATLLRTTPAAATVRLGDPAVTAVPVALAAPAAVAPRMTAASGSMPGEMTTTELATSGPLSPVDSPLSWSVLAATRGQLGRVSRLRVGGAGTGSAPAATSAALPAYAPGEVLLAWNPGAKANDRALAMRLANASVMSKHGTQKMLETDQGVVYRLKVPGGTEAAIRALSKNPNVAFVEPNYQVALTATVNSSDPYYSNGSLWGMESGDSPTAYGPTGTTNVFGSGAEEAWGLGYTGSRSVVVAVLDTGIQINHPDLAANIWTNPREIPGDGIDNDGNGYTDDVNGWDFYYDDNTVYDGTDDSHGTHVAGTIGAVGGNGTGVAGVNWDVGILPVKFIGAQGGYISDAVDAMNYLLDTKSRTGANIVAVNNSWGGSGYSSALHSAINRAAKADILFVAAAGNSTVDTDTTANWPSNYSTLQASATESAASYEAVISVGSITSTGGLSSFSNYGSKTVDLAAPGSSIISTVPGGYASYNGTSMAAPHVTGALALYKSYDPTANAAALRSAILNNVTPTTSLAGKTVTGGRLSLQGLFRNASPAPQPAPVTTVLTYDPAVIGLSAPGTVKAGKQANVTVTVANYGNTAAQIRVTLTASGGSSGTSTIVTVPGGGQVNTVFIWKAPTVRSNPTLTAALALVDSLLVDADPANNSRSITVKVN